MNEMKLIALFYYVCECYDTHLQWICQRHSNNCEPKFLDVEALTIYLFAVIEEEKFKVKSIHSYAERYLLGWFPKLPSYQAFGNRLNRLSGVFPALVACLLRDVPTEGVEACVSLLDSMPVITCSGKRRGRVAPELTDKGYCSTKKLHYFGAKLHGVAFRRPGTLPLPEYLGLTPASGHDLTAVRPVLHRLFGRDVFADKAYCDKGLAEALDRDNGTCIFTPVKLVRGEPERLREFDRAANDLFSTAVSRVRQPIESLFNWLIEKTDFQRASKVRSANGLTVHVFGKIAAALTLWVL